MHAFTLTIHSHLFSTTLPDDEMVKIAEKYETVIDELLVKHNICEHFTIEKSWGRGSFLLYLAFSAIDPSVWIIAKQAAIAAGTGATAMMTFFATYPAAKKGYNEFKNDILAAPIKHKGKNVKASELLECESKPSNKAKKLPIKKENNKIN